jgi:hypothetical protein
MMAGTGQAYALSSYANNIVSYCGNSGNTLLPEYADGDGYYAEGEACGTPADFNDNASNAYPGAQEICNDGIDNNCNAVTDTADMNAVDCPLSCTDADGDGYSIEGGSCGAMDCDDTNPEINPAALEVCNDGIDNNCDNRSDSCRQCLSIQ